MSTVAKHVERLPWQDEALCTQVSPDLWFPPMGSPAPEAKRICAECPVRMQCLEYALEIGVREGIWGGLGPAARQRLREGISA